MNHDERIKKLEAQLNNLPARFASGGAPGGNVKIFYTAQWEDEGYPYGNQVYRCYPINEERPEVEDIEEWYLVNSLTSPEIPEGTPILGLKWRGTWHTDGLASGIRITEGTNAYIVPNAGLTPWGGYYEYEYWDDEAGELATGNRPFSCAEGQFVPVDSTCWFIGIDTDAIDDQAQEYLLCAPSNARMVKATSETEGQLVSFPNGGSEVLGDTITVAALGGSTNAPVMTIGAYHPVVFIGKWVLAESGCPTS